MSEEVKIAPSTVEESPGLRALSKALRIFFVLLKVLMVLTAVYFVLSGMFALKPNEVGIVLRFGRIHGTYEPGRLHWAFPYPIDEVVKIERGIPRHMVVKNFWYTENFMDVVKEDMGQETDPGGEGGLTPGREGYCLTGDANIIHFAWIVRYKIEDVEQFFLNLAAPVVTGETVSEGEGPADIVRARAEPFVEAAVTNAVVEQAGRMKIDDIMKGEQEHLKEAVAKMVRTAFEEMKTGIVLEELSLSMEKPKAVKTAFDAVLKAQMEKETTETEARKYSDKLKHEGEAEATKVLADAGAYKQRAISSAGADADYIKSLPSDPKELDVYLQQYYLEVLDEVLSNVQSKYVVSTAPGDRGNIWIMYSKDPKELEPDEEEK